MRVSPGGNVVSRFVLLGFSSALARQPENCGKCHLGPDHPQMEIYTESKHGIQFRANIAKMNLDAKSWVVGRIYRCGAHVCNLSHERNQQSASDTRCGRPY